MYFSVAEISNKGGRKYNEDFVLHSKSGEYGCYVVADGLGGHRAGEMGSELACKTVIAAFDNNPGATLEHLKAYLEETAAVMDKERTARGLENEMKTTLVVLLTDSQNAFWAHIGDSRLYFFKSGVIDFTTTDHSLPQKMVEIGEITKGQVRNHEDRNRLLKVFENSDISRFSFIDEPVSIEPGDAFLMCSDGFWEYVFEDEMETDLAEAVKPEEWISLMLKRLTDRVEKKHDNYTAQAIMLQDDRNFYKEDAE